MTSLKEKSKYSSKIKIYDNSDKYWDKMWSKIDESEESIFIITYCMDNQFVANYTFIKLIKALERKVPVVLMIEDINYYPDDKLLEDFENKGGIIVKPNKLKNITKHTFKGRIHKFFNRSHQKLYLIDKNLFIGSANLAKEYTDYNYGDFSFYDLNMYIRDTVTYKKCLSLFQRLLIENFEEIRYSNLVNYQYIANNIFKKYLLSTYDKEIDKIIVNNYHNFIQNKTTVNNKEDYNCDLIKKKVTDNIIENYKLNNVDNIFDYSYNENNNVYNELFLEEKPPELDEIQNIIYLMIEKAEKQITIIQPYYLRIKKLDDLLIKAKKRGVDVNIITAYNRDQPAYKHLYNAELFSHLIKENITVKEYMHKYIHMKAYYIDNKHLTIGSMNNDITSFLLNNEANYFISKNKNNYEAFNKIDSIIENLNKDSRIVNNYYNYDIFEYEHVNNNNNTVLQQYKNKYYNYNFNLFRYISNKWWYFFVLCMEKSVYNRKID